jgi:hypothetical protein
VEFDPPSAATVLRAFHVGMAPKQYVLDRYDRGLPCWECFGMPHKLWLDRSREFESEALLAAADVFGLDLAFRTPRKRWFEGSLEDWFGRLKVHSYGDPSGFLAWEWMDRQRPAADKLPVFDVSEVTRMLTFWVRAQSCAISSGGDAAVWATIWAICDTARLAGLRPGARLIAARGPSVRSAPGALYRPSNGLDPDGVRDPQETVRGKPEGACSRFWNGRRLCLPVPRGNDAQRREPPSRLGCRDGDGAAFNHIEFSLHST